MAMQFKVAGDIIKQDGFMSLYKGLGAGLLRQATYTTARLGIFNTLSEKLKESNEGKVSRICIMRSASLFTPVSLQESQQALFHAFKDLVCHML